MEIKPVVLVSCGIFREELEYLVREKKLDENIVFLDAALHVNFDKLKERLTAALEEEGKKGAELRVLYGHCHPEMTEIMERYGARKIRAANCLEAMVGGEELKKLESEARSFYLSAGWVNNWEEMFAAGEKDLDFDFRSMFGSYRRIVVFETDIIPINEEKVRKFSEFTGLPVERRKITLDRLLDLIEHI